MADYFKEEPTQVDESIVKEGSEEQQEDESLSKEIKELLVARLEEEILGNLDVNFLFNKGDKLRYSLIDENRLYRIMLKIKEVAQKQIQDKGSKQIDYIEIVSYLEEEDQLLKKGSDYEEFQEKYNAQQVKYPTAEPRKTKIPKEEVIDENQWIHIVDFMRKNPKLMLQMLPDFAQSILPEKNDSTAPTTFVNYSSIMSNQGPPVTVQK